MNSRYHGLVLLAILTVAACRADTVYLTDGSEINGTVVEEDAKTVVVRRTNGSLQSFRRADVDVIVYESRSASAKKAPAAVAKKGQDLPKKTETAQPKEADTKTAAGATGKTEQPKESAGTAKTAEGTAKPAEGAAAAATPEKKEGAAGEPEKKEGAAAVVKKEGEAAAEKKEGEAPTEKKEEAAAGEKKEGEATADKTEGTAAKTAKNEDKGKKTRPAAAAAGEDGDAAKEDGGEDTAEATDKKEEEEWKAPPGLSGFPDQAKRLPKDKEAVFTAALGNLATMDDAQRKAAEDEISGLGPGVMPYLVAGCYHTNVTARSSCMSMIGRLNGRNAIKQVLEIFYAALPADGAEPPTYQGPFLEAIRTTLSGISGQDFFTGDPRRPIVHGMMRNYIEWYEKNYDRLPVQLGEKEIEATDPDYMKKLTEARALKLERKSWPQPPLSADIVAPTRPGVNREAPTAKQMIRPADTKFEKSIKTVKDSDVGKRY